MNLNKIFKNLSNKQKKIQMQYQIQLKIPKFKIFNKIKKIVK